MAEGSFCQALFVRYALFRKLHEPPCQFGTSKVLTYSKPPGAVITVPRSVEGPCEGHADVLVTIGHGGMLDTKQDAGQTELARVEFVGNENCHATNPIPVIL